jgi:hypothetical protein
MQKKTFSLIVFHGSAKASANMAAQKFANNLRQKSGCHSVIPRPETTNAGL